MAAARSRQCHFFPGMVTASTVPGASDAVNQSTICWWEPSQKGSTTNTLAIEQNKEPRVRVG